jgi:hypothetical protein
VSLCGQPKCGTCNAIAARLINSLRTEKISLPSHGASTSSGSLSAGPPGQNTGGTFQDLRLKEALINSDSANRKPHVSAWGE